MISVGMDVSKGKSTVCIMKPGGEVLRKPFELTHTKVLTKDDLGKGSDLFAYAPPKRKTCHNVAGFLLCMIHS